MFIIHLLLNSINVSEKKNTLRCFLLIRSLAINTLPLSQARGSRRRGTCDELLRVFVSSRSSQ